MVTKEVDPNLLKKIQALLNLADPEHGGTEAERDLAMQKAQELMFKHDLEAFDLTTEEERKSGVTHEEMWTTAKSKTWVGMLLNDLATPLQCKVIRTKYSVKEMKWTLIGTPDNIRFVRQLHDALVPWLVSQNRVHRRRDNPRNPNAYNRAFYDQAGRTIGHRLREQRNHLKFGNEKGTELVLYRERDNEDYISKLFGQVRMGRNRNYSNLHGAIAGQQAGEQASLNYGDLNA